VGIQAGTEVSPGSGILGGVVERNRVSAGTGIKGGRVVAVNNVTAATLGISSTGHVLENRVISGGTGVEGSETTTFEGNLIEATSAPLSGTGRDLGGNVCNGAICPAIASVQLRNADTDALIQAVESGDAYSVSAAGGCLAMQVNLNETGTSLRYDWNGAIAYRSEINEPFCWAMESGWVVPGEIANCGCSSEMAAQMDDEGRKLVLTPCSVDVDFGLGQTCAGNGGVAGVSRTLYFTVEP
jgi:hypothetical protein